MRRRAVLTALGLALALLSREHAQPFDTRYTEPDVPYDPAFPRRLTFNGAEDVAPAWLPDGSGIMYSYQVPQPDSEQCLGILPAEGGHLSWSACPAQAPLAADSTRVLTQPAVGPASSPTGVQVRGNVLVADVAGALYRVDLASGALAPIASAGLVLDPDPALSPSGTRVVVQARADSAALANRDLWLLQVP